MAFKEDESFLLFLTMGAVGSAVAWRELEKLGHTIVELDRGGSGNKLWATKLKRQRPPDLLCTRCGKRFEVRAKSNIEIRMSHAPKKPERHWDAGLRPNDICIFLHYREDPEPSAGTTLNAFRVGDLKDRFADAKLGKPKSADEGAEQDVTWPTWAPGKAGQVVAVSDDDLKVRYSDGKTYTYKLRPKTGPAKRALLKAGDSFPANEKIIAAVVEAADLACGGGWIPDLSEACDVFDVYCDLKAINSPDVARKNQKRLSDLLQHDDVRLRLEAAGALAKSGDAAARNAIFNWALKHGDDEHWAMEAVFILGEIGKDAEPLLHQVIAQAAHSEARCAAIWALQRVGTDVATMIALFDDPDDEVVLHAVVSASRMLVKPEDTQSLLSALTGSDRVSAAAYNALRLAARVVDLGEVFAFLKTAPADSPSERFGLFVLVACGRADVMAHTGWKSLPQAARSKVDWAWSQRESDWMETGLVPHKLDLLHRQR